MFDTDDVKLTPAQTTVTYNLDSLARTLFAKANWNNKGYNLTQVIYTEMGLSSNQAYTDVINSKTNWNIQGQNSTQLNPFPVATNFTQIELVQQRIRMFNVTYIVSMSQQEQERVSFLY